MTGAPSTLRANAVTCGRVRVHTLARMLALGLGLGLVVMLAFAFIDSGVAEPRCVEHEPAGGPNGFAYRK